MHHEINCAPFYSFFASGTYQHIIHALADNACVVDTYLATRTAYVTELLVLLEKKTKQIDC